MICPNCHKKIRPREFHIRSVDGGFVYSCSPKAERSEVLQGCPPSATGSADARASDEAGADSSGRSADGKAVRRDLSPTEAEIALKLNEVLDQLRWFYDRGIKLEISPAEQGWSLKLTMIDTSADAHSGA